MSRFESLPIEGESVHDMINEEEQKAQLPVNAEHKIGWFRYITSLVTSSPYDIYLTLNEHIELIDWDSKALSIAWPTGNILTLLFFGIRFLQDNVIKPNYYKINRNTDGFDFSKSQLLKQHEYFSKFQSAASDGSFQTEDWYFHTLRYLERLSRGLIAILILTNLVITYKFLFGYFRVYSFFSLEQRPDSKNVTKRSLHDLGYRYVEDVSKSSLLSMIKYVLFQRKKHQQEELKDEYYYELRKWCPTKFATSLFTAFSPTCVVFLFFTEASFKGLLALLIHQYLFHYLIFDRYNGRIQDEICIAKAVMAEVDEKIIKPKNSVKSQDAMVDATPYGNEFVRFFPSYTTTRSHIFQTHTLTGDLITEKFNPRTQLFEDVFQNTKAENFIKPSRDRFHGYVQSPRVANINRSINGTSVRPMFLSRQVSPSRHTGSPRLHNASYAISSSSAPSTPILKPSNAPYFEHSMVGNVSGGFVGNLSAQEHSRPQRTLEGSRIRRNSTSPLKSTNTHSQPIIPKFLQKPTIDENSTMYSMDVSEDKFQLEELARRGRNMSGNVTTHSNRSSLGRISTTSSRNGSVSPSKRNLSWKRGSTDSRPPFR